MISLLTFHTLRFLTNNEKVKDSFFACKSPLEVKSLIWSLYKDTFIADEKRLSYYSNVKKENVNSIDLIDDGPKLMIVADENYYEVGAETSKNNFVKGMSLCDFDAIYNWLVDYRKEYDKKQ